MKQQNIISTPNLSQKPDYISKSNKWSKILIFTLSILLVVSGSIFFGIQIGKRQTELTLQEAIGPTAVLTEDVVQPTAIPSKPIVTQLPEKSMVKVDPISTQGWKKVQNNDVYFKIPANATCNNETECSEVSYPIVYQGKTLPMPARILVNVSEYKGGSRRGQFLEQNKSIQECRPIYVETKFGAVDALQIAIDGEWCQGGYDGAIVAVVGNKFVTIGPVLNYNKNKEISRWDERDTLISTLSSK